MRFMRRRDWQENRSIIDERERDDVGQIIWKGENPIGEGDVFLVRIGKDASRQVIGTKYDARDEALVLDTELRNGTYVPPQRNLRFDTFLSKHFLPWKRRQRRSVTVEEYARLVDHRISGALGHHRLQELDDERIQDWVDDLWAEGLRPKTIRNYFSVVRAALARAVSLGIIPGNPAEQVQWERSPGDEGEVDFTTHGLEEEQGCVDRSRIWDAEEAQRFAEAADSDDEMARWGLLGLRGGFRPGEQCALRWHDLDLETGIVQIRATIAEVKGELREKKGRWIYRGGTKTEKPREVRLPPDAVRILAKQMRYVQQLLEKGKITEEEAVFVFPSRGRGKNPYNNPSNMKDRWRKYIVGRKDRKSQNGLAGVRYIPPYGLRHTHATDLLRHDWKVFNVAKRLGTSIRMIEDNYGHLLPDMQERRITDMTPLPGLTDREDAMQAVDSSEEDAA